MRFRPDNGWQKVTLKNCVASGGWNMGMGSAVRDTTRRDRILPGVAQSVKTGLKLGVMGGQPLGLPVPRDVWPPLLALPPPRAL